MGPELISLLILIAHKLLSSLALIYGFQIYYSILYPYSLKILFLINSFNVLIVSNNLPLFIAINLVLNHKISANSPKISYSFYYSPENKLANSDFVI